MVNLCLARPIFFVIILLFQFLGQHASSSSSSSSRALVNISSMLYVHEQQNNMHNQIIIGILHAHLCFFASRIVKMQALDAKHLLGVTYSEFHNIVGPQLLYEYPENAISPDTFEAVSEYVIVGKHLCEKIIMVKIDNIKFVNFSVAIENSKVRKDKYFAYYDVLLFELQH